MPTKQCGVLIFIILAVAGAARGWTLGSGLKYKLTTTLLFKEAGPPRNGGDVGFQLTGELAVTAVWKDPNDDGTLLLRIEVKRYQFKISSIFEPSIVYTHGEDVLDRIL